MKVPQFKSYIDKSDYQELEKVFENNYIAEGPFAKEFHGKLLEITGAEYGCFACNGTLALYLALRALGIGPGDEVIVQNTTFIASANAVEMTGAKPVFVDVLAYNDASIDLTKIAITPNTKGILIAHLFGTACSNIEEVQKYCKKNNLYLIEDAAQALFIENSEKSCGTFGDVATFSFYADKTITTGEGGFVITNNEDIYEKMLFLRNQGRKSSGTFIHPEIGYNFRITDMQAALGLAQLKKINFIKETKANIYSSYQKYLGEEVDFYTLNPDFNHIPFRVVVFVDNAHKVMETMSSFDIEPRTVFYPLHQQPGYLKEGYSDGLFPNSIECYEKGICLPTWIGLNEDEIEFVSNKLLLSIKKNLENK